MPERLAYRPQEKACRGPIQVRDCSVCVADLCYRFEVGFPVAFLLDDISVQFEDI